MFFTVDEYLLRLKMVPLIFISIQATNQRTKFVGSTMFLKPYDR